MTHPFQLGAKQMPLFAAPVLDELPAEVLDTLARTEAAVRAGSGTPRAWLDPWLRDDKRSLPAALHARLIHPLSPYFMQVDLATPPRSSLHERALCASLPVAEDWREAEVRRLIALVMDGLPVADRAIRTVAVRTFGDRFGNCVLYPPPEAVVPALDALIGFIARHARTRPLLTGVVAYAGIIAIHPFCDGNGRLARAMFNLLLRQLLSPGIFVPIPELLHLSEGGLIIRLRDALYNRRWAPLLEYFCAATEFALQPDSAESNPNVTDRRNLKRGDIVEKRMRSSLHDYDAMVAR